MPKKNQSILGRIGTFLDEAAKASAEYTREYNASVSPIEQMVAEHNAKFPSRPLYLTSTSPTKIKECGPYTVLADCRDTNCFRHYDEKKRAAARRASTL